MSGGSGKQRLVADVGGTNTRIALFDEPSGQLSAVATYINRDYDSFEAVLQHWLAQLNTPGPEHACIAVAAPPSADRVNMINMDWSFSMSAIARSFGFAHSRRINDFEANAYALEHLGPDDLVCIHPGATTSAHLATVGPGTGLGGASVSHLNSSSLVRSGEPGFMSLSPGTEYERALFDLIRKDSPELYAELLVSGPGLLRLYRGVCRLEQVAAVIDSPEGISREALGGADIQCQTALGIFCGLLGSVCGDFVLANGAYGGLFLTGGILPRMIPFLKRSSFQERFARKGAMQEQLEVVPVSVVTSSYPGLLGAAHAPL